MCSSDANVTPLESTVVDRRPWFRSSCPRFNELGRLVPLANTMTLTRQLRELEADGIVQRTAYPEVPPRVEYALTELGRSLEPIVEAMDAWGAEFGGQRR